MKFSLNSDYPVDRGQSLSAWLGEWVEMEKVRIARQQTIKLNMEGWVERTVEFWAHRLAPDDLVEITIKKLKEAYNETK